MYYTVLLMYAIIETGGKQYWVVPGETLKVEKLEAKDGSSIELKSLWAAEEGQADKSSQKGKVTAKVLRQAKAPKIIVFKKKPKGHYSKKIGHRQKLTEIRIEKISLN